MDRNLEVFVEGLGPIIKRDLDKHRSLLEQVHRDHLAFVQARSYEIARKKNWKSKIGGGKYDDDAMREAIKQINQNIRHFSAKIKLADEKIKHHKLIVDTLTDRLKEYQEEEYQFLIQQAVKRRKGNNASGN
jgi:hypothetical protein